MSWQSHDARNLASIADSLRSIAARRIPIDEVRIALDEIEDDGQTNEDVAEHLLRRFDIRERT